MRQNDFFLHFFAKKFAYIKKKQYLCIGFKKILTIKTNKIMKKISKKEFRDLLLSVGCALATCQKNQLINDLNWINTVWQEIATTALLKYPQNKIATWQMRYNYLHDLCKTLKNKN